MNQPEDKSLSLLKQKFLQLQELKNTYNEQELNTWKATVLMILENLIGDSSKYFHQFNGIDYSPHVWTKETYKQRCEDAYRSGLNKAESVIKAIIFGIENNLL